MSNSIDEYTSIEVIRILHHNSNRVIEKNSSLISCLVSPPLLPLTLLYVPILPFVSISLSFVPEVLFEENELSVLAVIVVVGHAFLLLFRLVTNSK